MQRYGQVIGVWPHRLEDYKKAHQQVWPEVLAMLSECNIHNYSIFQFRYLLFAYFEYRGDDYAADMQKMAAHAKTQEWWQWMQPMQCPLNDSSGNIDKDAKGEQAEWWSTMDEVFHLD